MNNPGLTNRLRQQSRRTGLAVGIAMAAAIALCIGVFVVAYAQLDPFTRDFVAQPSPTATPGGKTVAQSDSPSNDDHKSATKTKTPTPKATKPAATDTPAPTATSGFTPDYQLSATVPVRFRSGPGLDYDIVTEIDPGTQLQSTGNQQTDDSGILWLEFKLQDGTTGWVRNVDVSALSG